MAAPQTFTKVDLTPKRHHGYSVVLFILGTLFPPLAVAARFGFGSDFWLNLLLTICGYIPGHVHNFYIQNVRNNKNHSRTPKWAQRYGLINTDEIKRKERKSQWAGRYNDRLPRSTLEGRSLEDGQEGGSSIDLSAEGNESRSRQNGGDYWNPNEERYYGQNGDAASVRTGGTTGSGGGRWHYPANFEDVVPSNQRKKSRRKKDKKDRWARTEDAYSIGGEEGGGSSKRRKSKKKHRSTGDSDTYSRGSSTTEFPEDAEGGLYGDRPRAPEETDGRTNIDDVFSQEV